MRYDVDVSVRDCEKTVAGNLAGTGDDADASAPSGRCGNQRKFFVSMEVHPGATCRERGEDPKPGVRMGDGGWYESGEGHPRNAARLKG